MSSNQYSIEQLNKCFKLLDPQPINIVILKLNNNKLPLLDKAFKPAFLNGSQDVSSFINEDKFVPKPAQDKYYKGKNKPYEKNDRQTNNQALKYKNDQHKNTTITIQKPSHNDQQVENFGWELPDENDDMTNIVNQKELKQIRHEEPAPENDAVNILDILNQNQMNNNPQLQQQISQPAIIPMANNGQLLDPSMVGGTSYFGMQPMMYSPVQPQMMIPTMQQPQFIPPQHQNIQQTQSYQWQYIDPKGVTRGPFNQEQMRNWFVKNQLPYSLPIKLMNVDNDFTSLKHRWNDQIAQGMAPFSVPPSAWKW